MRRFYTGLPLFGFACFILVGCSMSATLEPVHFETVINAKTDSAARNNNQLMGHQGENPYGLSQVESSGTNASEDDYRSYQNWLGKEESPRESTLDNETSIKRNQIMKANGEESCRLLGEGVDSSDNE